jgi:hypothetical protein
MESVLGRSLFRKNGAFLKPVTTLLAGTIRELCRQVSQGESGKIKAKNGFRPKSSSRCFAHPNESNPEQPSGANNPAIQPATSPRPYRRLI